jgi:hypothetical protein
MANAPSYNTTNFNKSTVTVATSFTGGVNQSVLPTDILDTQSPDMKNIWYKDGMLRTRPGIITKSGVVNNSKRAINTALINKVKALTDFYIPTIYTNCNSRGAGNYNEDYNIMTPHVKVLYTPAQGDKTFKFPDDKIDHAEIKVHYRCPLYTQYEDYTIPASNNETSKHQFTNDQGNIYTITIDYSQGLITWANVEPWGDDWTGFTDSALYNVINELEFEYAKTVYPTNPITSCTLSQWFGGSLSGLGNGDCLMLSGNPLEPNKYWWSAMDDISYWPAHNWNSCGDNTEPIVALAKQSNLLIAFATSGINKKVYEIQYNSEQPNSTSVPYEPFPRSLISEKNGCDCPDTIELIDNCLTWLNSEGDICRLVDMSNRDENAIVVISQNIRPAIKSLSKPQLQAATACDTGRYYIVFAGQQAFAWDYDAITFINYSSTEKAQNRLAWYLWTTPFVITDAFYDGYIELSGGTFGMSEDTGADLGSPFTAYVYTKNFDFKAITYWKSIYQQCFKVLSDSGYLVLQIKDDYGTIDISQSFSISAKPQLIQLYQTSMTQLYQAYISRPAGSTARFAISEFVSMAQIAAKV